MSLKSNLSSIQSKIRQAASKSGRKEDSVTLVAVSKRKPLSAIREAYDAGQTCFGENYLQDAIEKIENLPEASWHFIGRIQTNKSKQIARYFDVVETVDRLKVARALEKHLAELGKTMKAYIQINIGREEQKAGVMPEDASELFHEVKRFSSLKIAGLMALPPYSDNPENTRVHFRQLRELAKQLEVEHCPENPLGLSMGMSGDFEVAIEEGATLVRVGTAIFGPRE